MPKKEIKFQAGDVLFKKGDICDGVFIIIDGSAEHFLDVRGKIRPLREEKAGAVLGKKGVFDGRYDSSVRAKTDLTVEQLSKEEYIAQLQKEGELTPSIKQENDFSEENDDFNFNFDFSDEEEKEKNARQERPSRRRSKSTALRQTDDVNFNDSLPVKEKEQKKNELIKVGNKTPTQKTIVTSPVILPVDEKISPLKEWLVEGQAPKVEYGTCFLMASIDGDDGTYRQELYKILSEIPESQVKIVDKCVVELNPRRASLQMSAWMKRYDADAGLYARLDAAGRVLEFHTVRLSASAENVSSGDTRFFLPVEMTNSQKSLLKAFAVCSLMPTRLEHEQLQSAYLPFLLNEAREAGASPIVGLTTEEQSVDMCCFADALSLAAFYVPQANALREEASRIYEQAYALMPSHVPEYAFIGRQLGLMCQIKGEKNQDVDLLRQAEKMFDSATKSLSMKRSPLIWGDLKTRLGAVRQQIAVNTGNGDDFDSAVDAYREALDVLTPEKDVEKWADALNGLARTVQMYGMFGVKTVLLDRAKKIYDKELALLDAQKFPMQRARALNNQASVLFMLFNRKKQTSLLQQAVCVFAEALALYENQSEQKKADVVSENLKKAETLLAQVKSIEASQKTWMDFVDEATDEEKTDLSETTGEEDLENLHFEKITLPEELSDEEE